MARQVVAVDCFSVVFYGMQHLSAARAFRVENREEAIGLSLKDECV